MCVIIVDPEGKELPRQILQNAVDRNPAGWGLAVQIDGTLRVTKGFGLKRAWRAWKTGDGHPRVFHARVATSGKTNIANCHPFDAAYFENQPRLLFHNGTVNIPRVLPDYSDSWHLAQYLQQFDTDEDLLTMLGQYATNQHSRFVLMSTTQIILKGSGWFTRDGVMYSNPSALANIVEHKYANSTSYSYGGGLLEDTTVEVTSNSPYMGFGWDADRKLYTNRIKPSVIEPPKPQQNWSAPKSGAPYGQGPASHIPVAQTRRPLAPPAKWEGSDAITAENVLDIIWMHNRHPNNVMMSWPRTDGKYGDPAFDFGDVGGYNGRTRTRRASHNGGVSWYELKFDKDGGWLSKEPVDGPYQGGLLIKGGQDMVTYGTETMSIETWQTIMLMCYFPDLLDAEKGAEAITNQSDEEFLQNLEQVLNKGKIVAAEADETATA